MNTLPILLMCCSQHSALNVSDFFPLAPGTKWTYQVSADAGKSQCVYTAGDRVKVGRGFGNPVSIVDDQGNSTTIYYRIQDNTVFLLGNSADTPLADPQPMLRLGGVSEKWGYDYLDRGEPVNVTAHVTTGERRKVLGTDREVIELDVTLVIGGGRKPLTQSQKAYYAKGVGLVEWDTSQLVGGRDQRHLTITLTKFEPVSGAK